MGFKQGDIRYYMQKRNLEGYVFGKSPSIHQPAYVQLTIEETRLKQKLQKLQKLQKSNGSCMSGQCPG